MKKFIFFLVFIPILLFGQNNEPIKHKFIVPAIKQDSIYLSSDSSYFRQDKMILGNHWDSSPRLEKAVGYTQKDIYSGHIKGGKYSIADNTLLHVKLNEEGIVHFWTHCQGGEPLNARGIEYSPILTINPSLTHTIQTVSSSTRNPIFGFQTIVGTKDTVNDCLILDNSLSPNTVVLSEPWTADQFSSKSVS